MYCGTILSSFSWHLIINSHANWHFSSCLFAFFIGWLQCWHGVDFVLVCLEEPGIKSGSSNLELFHIFNGSNLHMYKIYKNNQFDYRHDFEKAYKIITLIILTLRYHQIDRGLGNFPHFALSTQAVLQILENQRWKRPTWGSFFGGFWFLCV